MTNWGFLHHPQVHVLPSLYYALSRQIGQCSLGRYNWQERPQSMKVNRGLGVAFLEHRTERAPGEWLFLANERETDFHRAPGRRRYPRKPRPAVTSLIFLLMDWHHFLPSTLAHWDQRSSVRWDPVLLLPPHSQPGAPQSSHCLWQSLPV